MPEPPARDAAWPAIETGPCGKCRAPTHRYGPGGAPLCRTCDPQLSAEPDAPPALRTAAPALRTITPAPARAPEPKYPQLELFA